MKLLSREADVSGVGVRICPAVLGSRITIGITAGGAGQRQDVGRQTVGRGVSSPSDPVRKDVETGLRAGAGLAKVTR